MRLFNSIGALGRAIGLLLSVASTDLVQGAVELVSRAGIPGDTASGDSGASSFSGDNRFVFFLSTAENLTEGGTDGGPLNLYRRDLSDGTVLPVSSTTDASTTDYSASADGRWVVFLTRSKLVASGNDAGAARVLLRDMQGGAVRVISHGSAGTTGSWDAASPLVSADGRFAMFESTAPNIAGTDANLAADVFVHDIAADTNNLVSATSTGASGDAGSSCVALGADGRVLVFRSASLGIAPAGTGYTTDLYVRDRVARTTRRIVLPGTVGGSTRASVHAYNPVLSPDGQFLAFRSDVTGGTFPRGVWWYDLVHGTNAQPSGSLTGPALGDDLSGPVMSGDGRTLAFEASAPNRIVVWNADTGLHELDDLVSTVPPANAAPTNTYSPVLSRDGALLAYQMDGPANGAGSAGAFGLYIRRLSTGETRGPIAGDAGSIEMPYAGLSSDNASLLFQTTAPVPAANDLNGAGDVVLASLADGGLRVLTARAPGNASATAAGASSVGEGAMSDDGRHLVFTRFAGNLFESDGNGAGDVFVRDLADKTMRLASVSTNGAAGNGGSGSPRITGNGRFVVFTSMAGDLADGDTNTVQDVYLRDLTLGTTVLASAIDGTTQASAGNRAAGNPVVSADGRYVAFESLATDLVPGFAASGAGPNVYLRDVASNRTYILSDPAFVANSGVGNSSRNPRISDDGHTVIFVGGTGPVDVFIYSVPNKTLVRSVPNPLFAAPVTMASLSADGKRVAYARAGGVTALYWRDNVTGANTEIARSSGAMPFRDVTISGDGRRVAFTSRFVIPGSVDADFATDVFVHDIASNVVTESSAPGRGFAANGASDSPSLSKDGKRLAFHTFAGNIDGSAPAGAGNIIVRDLDTGVAALVSRRASDGLPGSDASGRPVLSGDGMTVAFVSFAADLVTADLNQTSDVFVATMPDFASYDGDGDGLPDAWEMASFANLAQGPDGDFDGDGASNRDEYLAGTDPVRVGSVFRATGVATDGKGGIVIAFDTAIGVVYRVETSATLDGAGFHAVGDPIPGTGQARTVTVPTTDAAGFARLTAHR